MTPDFVEVNEHAAIIDCARKRITEARRMREAGFSRAALADQLASAAAARYLVWRPKVDWRFWPFRARTVWGGAVRIYPKIAAKAVGLAGNQRKRMTLRQLAADDTAALAAVSIDGRSWWIIRQQHGQQAEVLRYLDGFCLERGPVTKTTARDRYGRRYQSTGFTGWADELHPRQPVTDYGDWLAVND